MLLAGAVFDSHIPAMPAFVNTPPLLRLRIQRNAPATVNAPSRFHPNFRTAGKRRQQPTACAQPLHGDQTGPTIQDALYDDLVSDDDFVVLDGKDIVRLVEELQRTGQDQIGQVGTEDAQDDDGLAHDFLTLAEKRSDEWNGRVATHDVVADEEQVKEQIKQPTDAGSEPQVGMQYFHDDHVQFMPSWAAEAYRAGEHLDLEEAAMRITPVTERLHDIVARKKATDVDHTVGHDGIVDCTVQDVATDYSIPVEFVVDAMIHYGVPVPIRPDQSIRNSMTTDEIQKLLNLITLFDAQDLADRYSDRTISELADDYDLSTEHILDVCQKEALYVCSGEQTRLSVVREDRVLDIILKGRAMGQPYPSLLQGLVAQDDSAS